MEENVFALVYVDEEELLLLEIGKRDFILEKYNERIKQRKDFEKRFEKSYDPEFNMYNVPEDKNEIEAFIDHKGRSIDKLDRLCIMGYKDDRITCVCKDFGINNGKMIFY
ncbi:MAG TPA: hypothetical protein DC057_00125 [Spirochaetia bacterium]|nr:hypothetical protein [Spirochaetia bacterium]